MHARYYTRNTYTETVYNLYYGCVKCPRAHCGYSTAECIDERIFAAANKRCMTRAVHVLPGTAKPNISNLWVASSSSHTHRLCTKFFAVHE